MPRFYYDGSYGFGLRAQQRREAARAREIQEANQAWERRMAEMDAYNQDREAAKAVWKKAAIKAQLGLNWKGATSIKKREVYGRW